MSLLNAGLLVLAGFATFVNSDPADDAPTDSSTLDCGTIALYGYLRSEGVTLSLADLTARLPVPRKSGHSLLELLQVARDLGVNARGVRWTDVGPRPDRPFLAYLRSERHGHFFVVRPVGHTGTLVQILDPNQPPDVIDSVAMTSDPRWTGIGLYVQPRLVPWSSMAFGAVGVGAIVAAVIEGRRRSR